MTGGFCFGIDGMGLQSLAGSLGCGGSSLAGGNIFGSGQFNGHFGIHGEALRMPMYGGGAHCYPNQYFGGGGYESSSVPPIPPPVPSTPPVPSSSSINFDIHSHQHQYGTQGSLYGYGHGNMNSLCSNASQSHSIPYHDTCNNLAMKKVGMMHCTMPSHF